MTRTGLLRCTGPCGINDTEGLGRRHGRSANIAVPLRRILAGIQAPDLAEAHLQMHQDGAGVPEERTSFMTARSRRVPRFVVVSGEGDVVERSRSEKLARKAAKLAAWKRPGVRYAVFHYVDGSEILEMKSGAK